MTNEKQKERYYWIKLSTNFLTSRTVDFLMSQKGGSDYVVLYQVLCMLTINNEGRLADNIGEMLIPYDVDKIVRDAKWFSKDTVIVALTLYQKLGLIYSEQDGILQIAEFNKLVGSETYGAILKRNQRNIGNKLLGGQKVDNVHKDIENRDRYRDIDIDIEKDINKEKIIISSNDNKKENLEDEPEWDDLLDDIEGSKDEI